MADDLESLVKRADSDIQSRSSQLGDGKRQKSHIPRVSVAIAIWVVAIVLAVFQFETVMAFVAGPAESKIERDLGGILQTAATSLSDYQIENGQLPPILPNPSIRGLVKYERHDDFTFTLRATIHNVTLVLESSKMHPYREESHT